ncbi:hypothetical protein [Rhizobium leucaenae]|uniref:Uncharacterized protein n=1 Tax=Rhizobium leucaenae TaxID=29450 RepID=A0A7W6ZQB6_9HYPH|nr:hypothetical protein [Rhizobium leucaenae]MBB4566769.1 hypothetical protein [Rhizobium leucaenae]MBB6301336.1 hypothetical protein [Rhizobium leucaenae]
MKPVLFALNGHSLTLFFIEASVLLAGATAGLAIGFPALRMGL